MRALQDEFVAESKERLEALDAGLRALERRGGDVEAGRLVASELAARTTRRTAGLFGFEKISELARAIEGVIALIRSGDLAPDADAIDALLRAGELIAASLEDLDRGYEIDVAESVAALDDIRREHEPATASLDDLRQPLRDEEGEDVGFEVEYFALRGAVEKFKRLYKLDFELSDMTRYDKRTPVELIREALLDGAIVEARIRNMEEDLHAGLPHGPLRYEVIYATNLPLDVVRERMSLDEKDVASLRVEYDLRNNGEAEPREANAPSAERPSESDE